MKNFILLLCLLPALLRADPFDWEQEGVDIAVLEMATDAGQVVVRVGSLCYASVCEVAAVYVGPDSGATELLERTIADEKARASLDRDQLKISLIHYPRGLEHGIRQDLWFRWENNRLMQIRQEKFRLDE